MKSGSLSDWFDGVGVKTLRGTEIDPTVSNGHELQGVEDFRAFIGFPTEKTVVPVTWVWLDDDAPPEKLPLTGTWYDSRKRQLHREPEFRLYYPKKAEEIVYRARPGDTLFLAQPKRGPLLAMFCRNGSSIESQLLWLFGLEPKLDETIRQQDLRERDGRALDMAARHVLELIGVEVIATEDEWLRPLLRKFGGTFPTTKLFSAYARQIAGAVDPVGDPDGALLRWMEVEERLFMTLERHLVGMRLEAGFMEEDRADVEGFIQYSLSVQNRRKSRAGQGLGNHVEAILIANCIAYRREATTEKRAGPDFLFPSELAYHDLTWPRENLTMLATKTSCKDRWRQVLAEADHILEKHLLTLEPGISEMQTNEMEKERLQLVLPRAIHASYRASQHRLLMGVNDFIYLVKARAVEAATFG